jgi:enamine deaminase RidA (YjgF/YER057c/UK114 family)
MTPDSLPGPVDAPRSRVRSLVTTILFVLISVMIVRDILVRRWRGCAIRRKALKPRQSRFIRIKPEIEVQMPRRLISTGSPFEKTAGYSRAVIDGDFAFVAGTTGYDYATMTMPSDVTSQSRNCFKTIEAALKEGGFAMADIVRATYYITDAKEADAHFAVCGEVLGDIRPAATLVVVTALYKPEMKIEIEVTAKRRTA